MKILLVIFLGMLVFSCNRDSGIDDPSKRNENWVWWVDQSSGVGEWIPYANYTSVKNGAFTDFYSNGLIYSHGKLKDGVRIDTVYYYGLNGKLSRYRLYLKDTSLNSFPMNGPYEGFSSSGRLREKGIVENHHIGDHWIWYFENGKVEGIRELKNGTGWKINYYETGQIKDSTHCTNDIQDGRSVHWFGNGQLMQICYWKMGVQGGEFTSYYENGNLQQKSYWKDGELDGKATSYYENGQKKSDYKFRNGKKDGLQCKYYENGKLMTSGIAISGQQDGIWKWYDSKGNLSQTDTYRNGQLINVVKHNAK